MRLASESCEPVWIVCGALGQDLQGDVAMQLRVAGPVQKAYEEFEKAMTAAGVRPSDDDTELGGCFRCPSPGRQELCSSFPGSDGVPAGQTSVRIGNQTPYPLRVCLVGPRVECRIVTSGATAGLDLQVGSYEVGVDALAGRSPASGRSAAPRSRRSNRANGGLTA
jgi:hypothetical protein